MDLILLPRAREAGGGGAGSEAAGQRSGPRASPELDFCETRVARQKQKTPPAPARPGWDVLFLRDERGGRLRPPVGPLASSSGTVRRTAGWEGTVARVELLLGGWNLQENPHHWTLGAWAPEEGWGLSGRGEAEVQPGSDGAATACGVPTSCHMKRSSGQRKREQTSEVGVKIWARPTSCPHGKRQPCGLGSPGALAGTSSLRSGPQKKGRVGCGAEGTCHPCDPPRPPHSVQKGWDPHGAAVCARGSVCNSKSGVSRGAK